MLAARGVSLGLGKINLSDLNQLPGDKYLSAQYRREEKEKARESKPRIIVKKKADAKTVWAACRAVIVGCIVIVVGLAMTMLGYFDKQFSARISIVDGVEETYHDKIVQYQLKSMQYLGPVLMGIGTFILIIACVVTLESRDKHAQIITEEQILSKRRRLVANEATSPTNEPMAALAPLADVDSIDLHSCSSSTMLDKDQPTSTVRAECETYQQ